MKSWLRKVLSSASVRPEPDDAIRTGDSKGQAGAAADSARTDAGGASALLQRLEWTTIKRLDGILQGDYRTLWRGFGLDFADLRDYQSHDDVRHMDWNVTARTGTPHVRVFTEDREMAAWFVLDLSASVDFGSGARRKRDVANEVTVVLARLLTRHGNRVGALLYGGAGQHAGIDKMLPAGSGRRQVLHLAHELLAHRAASNCGQTNLSTLLDAAGQVIKQRSTVFVLSDFFSTPGWGKSLQRLAQRHDVTAIRLVDPLEQQLPDLGLITLRDPETGETQLVDCDGVFLRRFSQLSTEHEASLREQLAQASVDTLEVSTQSDIAETLLRFCAMRRRKSRLRAVSALPQAA